MGHTIAMMDAATTVSARQSSDLKRVLRLSSRQ